MPPVPQPREGEEEGEEEEREEEREAPSPLGDMVAEAKIAL